MAHSRCVGNGSAGRSEMASLSVSPLLAQTTLGLNGKNGVDNCHLCDAGTERVCPGFFRMVRNSRVRAVSVMVVTWLTLACSTTDQFRPQYVDNGVRLSGKLAGHIELRNGCFSVQDRGQSTLLIFPAGTQFAKEGFTLPAPNGGLSVRTGDRVSSTGGYLVLNGEGHEKFQHTKCRGDAFLLNSMKRISSELS